MKIIKPKTKEIEKAACDGRVIAEIKDILFIDKGNALATAMIPAKTDIFTACKAMEEAEKRVEYSFGIKLKLRPCPIEIYDCANEQYKEASSVILSAIDKDLEMNNFASYENEKGMVFSFELEVPKEYKKNNAELLIELKKQFKKLSNKIVLDVTVTRFQS